MAKPAVQEGLRPRSDLDIVGGEMAPLLSRPYQAAVLPSESLLDVFCGGALVHTNWVLTAAHCNLR